MCDEPRGATALDILEEAEVERGSGTRFSYQLFLRQLYIQLCISVSLRRWMLGIKVEVTSRGSHALGQKACLLLLCCSPCCNRVLARYESERLARYIDSPSPILETKDLCIC